MSGDDLEPVTPRGWTERLPRAGWGAIAGVLAGLPIGGLMGYQGMLDDRGIGEVLAWTLLVAYSAIVGAAIGLVVGHQSPGLAVAASAGVLIGLLSWLFFSLTLDPVLHGRTPTWSVSAAAAGYRDLVGGLLHGSLTGLVAHGLFRLRGRRPRSALSPQPGRLARVVIVGGGFAGLGAARRFERLTLRGLPVDVTLISDSNFLLFTPMLAEVAAGALEPAHISAPIRAAVAHTRFRHGAVTGVDTEGRAVRLAPASGAGAESIPYDHLVLAVGSVPNFLGLPGKERHALAQKDLGDAMFAA